MTRNMKTLHSSETLVAIYMLRWYKIPEEPNTHVFTLGIFGTN